MLGSLLDWLLDDGYSSVPFNWYPADYKSPDGPLARIIPDVISYCTQEGPLWVSFPGAQGGVLTMGEEVKARLTARAPEVRFSPARKHGWYTLVMFDADPASGGAAHCHWLVMNIPGTWDLSQGTTIVPYAGCGPPIGTGKHRYVLAVLRQPSPDPVQRGDIRISRRHFDYRRFTAEHKLGNALAVSFFTAGADCSCKPVTNSAALVLSSPIVLLGKIAKFIYTECKRGEEESHFHIN